MGAAQGFGHFARGVNEFIFFREKLCGWASWSQASNGRRRAAGPGVRVCGLQAVDEEVALFTTGRLEALVGEDLRFAGCYL